MKTVSLLFFSCVLALGTMSQNATLFLNAHLHVGDGSVLESASVGVRDGRIALIKNTLTYRHDPNKWDTVIDLKGQHMYPGIVAPNTTLGLTEIDAVRATRDYDDVGTYNPHVRSLIAFNVESDVMTTVRTNGVLLAQPTPRGGTISGSSSIMQLDGWNWEDAAVKVDDGVHLNWPNFIPWNQDVFEKGNQDKNENKYEKEKQKIYAFFEMAKSYAEAVSPEIPEQRLEAMEAVFKGNKRLYIHAEELQQLLDVLDFCSHFKLKFPVIVGGYDSYLITPQLRDAKIPVMLPRVHSLPMREDDPIDLPFQLPKLLKEGGVLFCLQNEGDMEAMNGRNIPFLAGHTMGFGLTAEEALMSVTLNSCKIIGIDKDYGSIEVGKVATLFISSGPALEMLTNDVTMAMVQGRWINLNNRQQTLYQKYKAKYDNQN